MADDGLALGAAFPPVSEDDWRNLVEKTLRGKPFDKAMTAFSYDGIPLHGLYTRDNARIEAQPKGRDGAWGIVQLHFDPDANETNAAILKSLERGATAAAVRLCAGSLPGLAVADIPKALEGVYLNMAEVAILSGEEFEAASEVFLDLVQARGHKADEVVATLAADPIGILAQTGRLLTPAEDAIDRAAALAKRLARDFPTIGAFMPDGVVWHGAGATEAQELGLTLACGVAYLRACEEAGVDIQAAARQIQFSLATDADIFLTLAKFRAFRRLWQRVLDVVGAGAVPMRVNASASLRMMTVKDPWVNILRATAACMGGGLGGADTVVVVPHDTLVGLPSDFAQRIARNISIILQEESGLSAVMDPAAGSYAIESITCEISDKAWNYFQKIESSGGALSALRSGMVAADLEKAWKARATNIACRKDAVTGVSEFPNLTEKPLEVSKPRLRVPEKQKLAGEVLQRLPMHRLAEDYEVLRIRSETMKRFGPAPRVYLANLGPVAEHTARATFAKNFFEAGGIEAVSSPGFETADQIAEAFRHSRINRAVICGSDDRYDDMAAAVATALKKAGAHYVYLAGRPKDAEAMRAAGVDCFIHVGCNLIEILGRALDDMGGDE